jgi:protein SCO1/2
LAAAALPRAAAVAQTPDLPDALEGVGVTEHLDEHIPLDLEFVDELGKRVTLQDYFKPGRPVLLTLNYSNCPMLCSLQLNALVDGGDYFRAREAPGGLKGIDWTAGNEFAMLTVSIDPLETPTQAKLTQQRYMKVYGRPGAAQGWHFLTGSKENIQALADAIGFGFRWNEARKEYSHPAVTTVLTPDGRVSRYLYGVEYDPQTLRLSLVEAAEGRIGSTVDRIILYCFHYDADSGRYAPAAMNIMRVGGVLTVLVLGATLSVFWLRDVRRKRAGRQGTSS